MSDGTTTNPEAINSIASLYNNKTLTVDNIKVTGKIECDGDIKSKKLHSLEGLDTQGDISLTSPKNKWLIHTPNDDRGLLRIAPNDDRGLLRIAPNNGNGWEWSKGAGFYKNGNVTIPEELSTKNIIIKNTAKIGTDKGRRVQIQGSNHQTEMGYISFYDGDQRKGYVMPRTNGNIEMHPTGKFFSDHITGKNVIAGWIGDSEGGHTNGRGTHKLFYGDFRAFKNWGDRGDYIYVYPGFKIRLYQHLFYGKHKDFGPGLHHLGGDLVNQESSGKVRYEWENFNDPLKGKFMT